MDNIQEWFQLGVAIAVGLAGLGYGAKQSFRFFKKKKVQKDEERFSFVNMKIWELLTDTRITLKADRVSITQFHNGGKFVDGSSMRRMSISSQSCDQKIPSTMQFRQDVLVSRFVEIIDMIHDNDAKIRMVSSLNDSNTKKFYELHDTLAFSILPIYCSDSMVAYGYISVEWCNFETLDKLNDAQFKTYLQGIRSQVAFLLSTAKDYR